MTLRRRLLLILVVPLVAIVAAGWVVLRTQAGLDLVWSFVEPRLPPTLTVSDVSGRVIGPIEVEGITSTTDAATTTVGSVHFDWHFPALLSRRVVLDQVDVRDVRVVPGEAPAPDDSDAAADPSSPEPLPSIELPVVVRIARADVRGIHVTDVERFSTIDSVRMHGFVADGEWQIDSVFVRAPDGSLEGRGRLTPTGAYPHDVSARFDGVVEERTVTGSLDARGTADSIAIDASLSAPLSGSASGIVRDPRGELRFDLELSADSTWLPDVVADGPVAAAEGTVQASGTLDLVRLDGTSTVWMPELPRARVDFRLSRQDSVVLVDTVTVEIAQARFAAGGRVETGATEPRFDLAGGWRSVAWPLEGEAIGRSASGTARVSGTPTRYDVRASGAVEPVGAPGGDLVLRGRGTDVDFAIESATYATPGGRVTASGRVGWGDTQTARLEVSADRVETTALLPDTMAWSFAGDLSGRVSLARSARLLTTDVTIDTLSGRISGDVLRRPNGERRGAEERAGDAPLEASGSASVRIPIIGDSLAFPSATGTLRWLSAQVGTANAFASGRVGDTLGIHLTVVAEDLSTVSMRGAGRVDGKARIDGTRASPEVDVVAEASGLRWDSVAVETLSVDATVSARQGAGVDVTGSATRLSVGDRSIDSLVVRATGSVEAHSVHARVRAPEVRGETRLSGGLLDERWEGRIDSLSLEAEATGRWQLAREASAVLSRDVVTVDSLCVVEGSGSICGNGAWHRDSTSIATLSATGIRGAALAPLMPVGWSWDGEVEARSSLSVEPDRTVNGRIEVDASRGRLDVATTRGPSVLVTLPTTWIATVGEEGGRADFTLQLQDSTGREVVDLQSVVELPTLRSLSDSIPALDVRGSLAASVEDFTPIEAMLPRIEAIRGAFGLDVALEGTVGAPEFDGEADFRDGSFRVPELGIDVTDVRFRATGEGADGVRLEGSMTSGNELVVTGTIPQRPSAANPARIQLEGNRLLALDNTTGTARVSPDLDVEVSPDRIAVSGSVQVPVANIELSDVPESAVRPSADVVFVDDSLANRRRVPLNVEVRVELGDSVEVRGNGFSGRPTGTITARDGTAGQLVATGEIALSEGSYEEYGVELEVVNGRLIYAGGPLDDPGLDIRATRTAEDGVVAGLEIGGTLQAPVVTIFSEPAMLETEALSYLVLGRPIGQASQSDGNQLQNVATSLGLREGNALTMRLGQRFGLSELRVDAEGPLEQASLVAGRYLSPRLYVAYGVGLVDPVSTFRLRYLLSSKWTLSAESGESVGVDLQYRVERGR